MLTYQSFFVGRFRSKDPVAVGLLVFRLAVGRACCRLIVVIKMITETPGTRDIVGVGQCATARMAESRRGIPEPGCWVTQPGWTSKQQLSGPLVYGTFL